MEERCLACGKVFAERPADLRDPYFEEQGACDESCAEAAADGAIENEVDEALLARKGGAA